MTTDIFPKGEKLPNNWFSGDAFYKGDEQAAWLHPVSDEEFREAN